MPKDTKPLGALKRLAETQAKQGMMYGIQKLGLDTEGRQTILGMDPYAPPKKLRESETKKWSADVQKQLDLLQKRAAVAKAKKDAAEEKKVMDELAALMAAAPLGSEMGPSTSESRFAPTYERITNIPYEDAISGQGRRKSRKGKGKKGGKKTRKGGKTRRH